MTRFWINDIQELFNKNSIMDIWPREGMDMNEKLNAMSRLIILLTILGFFITKTMRILAVGVVTLAIIVFLHHQKKEGFSNSNMVSCNANQSENLKRDFYPQSVSNPLSNVMLPEINENPNRKMAPPAFNTDIKNQINKNTQKMVQALNPTQPNIEEKLFKDLGDNVDFHNSMIVFNSTPNTRIPNDQNAFANFLYGNMPSCRDPSNSPNSLACTNNPPRIGQVYN